MPSECNDALLHTGQRMPFVGLGTWKSDAGQVSSSLLSWGKLVKVFKSLNSVCW